jgi:hypothetical protein
MHCSCNGQSGSQVCKRGSTCSEVDLNSNVWLTRLDTQLRRSWESVRGVFNSSVQKHNQMLKFGWPCWMLEPLIGPTCDYGNHQWSYSLSIITISHSFITYFSSPTFHHLLFITYFSSPTFHDQSPQCPSLPCNSPPPLVMSKYAYVTVRWHWKPPTFRDTRRHTHTDRHRQRRHCWMHIVEYCILYSTLPDQKCLSLTS